MKKLTFEEFEREVSGDTDDENMKEDCYILYAEYLKGESLQDIIRSIIDGTVFEEFIDK